MHMTSRHSILATPTLAALALFAASAASDQGQHPGTAFPGPVNGTHTPRHRVELPTMPEPIALQPAAIEDSDENSTGRSRADETRNSYGVHDTRATLCRPPSAAFYHADLTPTRPLIYRLCKLLI
jgi:hypothetical protein